MGTEATDILKRIDLNSGVDVNYREVIKWYDGTPVTDEKCDGVIFRRKGGKYYQEMIDKNVLMKINSVADLRNFNAYYEGQEVTLLGYYNSGDKMPIIYQFTVGNYSSNVDDNGSCIKTSRGSWIAKFGEVIDARDFGFFPANFIPDLTNFQTQQPYFEAVRNYCIDNNKDLVLAPGNYCINVFRTGYAVGKMKIKITCNGIAKVFLRQTVPPITTPPTPPSSPTMVQIWDDCYMENIHFYSTELDLNNQRGSTENRKNIYLKNVGFFNFKNATNGNGWGLYMKNCQNITVDSCYFGGNTQSDIAIVDGVTGLTIINPVNNIDNAVYLNIEPNSISINRNIQLQGGHYRRINLLTNTITENPIQNMSIIGCEIDWLMLDGADVDIIASQIKLITNQEFVNIPMGVVDMNLRFGDNLIKDPYLVDYDYDSTLRFWRYGFSSTLQTDRVNKDFTRIGNRVISATTTLKSDHIPVDFTKKYILMANGRANYLGASINNISRFCRIRFYDENKIELVITKPVNGIPTPFNYVSPTAFRFPLSIEGTTGFINQVGLLEFELYAPLTKYITIEVGKFSSNTNEYDIKFLSLNEIIGYEKGESISSYISRNLPNGKYNITGVPPNNTTTNRTNGFKTGDILQNSAGGTFIVTDGSVRPAVVKNISTVATSGISGLVKQSVAVAKSDVGNATDLATAIILVNDLKAKLNAKLLADENSEQQAK